MSAWRTGRPDKWVSVLAETRHHDMIICCIDDDDELYTDSRGMYSNGDWDEDVLRWCPVSEVQELIEYGILIDPANPAGDYWIGD